jgi:hypothetical protein
MGRKQEKCVHTVANGKLLLDVFNQENELFVEKEGVRDLKRLEDSS